MIGCKEKDFLEVERGHRYSTRGDIIRRSGDRYFFGGIDMGGKMTSELGGDEEGVAIFKVAGHNGWSGVGNTSYNPPQFQIGVIKKCSLIGVELTFERKYEIVYTRAFAKQAKIIAHQIVEFIKEGKDFLRGAK